MILFGFGRSRTDDAARQRVEGWSRAIGGFAEGTIIKVNEIVCADPACPGFETVILVMEPGRRTGAWKIAKRVADIDERDVVAVLVER